jgi:hypothetical protein
LVGVHNLTSLVVDGIISVERQSESAFQGLNGELRVTKTNLDSDVGQSSMSRVHTCKNSEMSEKRTKELNYRNPDPVADSCVKFWMRLSGCDGFRRTLTAAETVWKCTVEGQTKAEVALQQRHAF